MRSIFRICLLVWSILATVESVSLPPTVDPFYQPVAGFTAEIPGKILRWRPVAAPDTLNGSANAFQLLYRSQDSLGLPSTGVTTVFVPKNVVKLDKIISLQTAYDSTAVDYSPSYLLTSDPDKLGETSALPKYLAQGWIVSVPDFEGFFAAFGNGLQAGYSTLDSIKAVLSSNNITKVSNTARVALLGGSGGAIGSEFALELMEEYAPTLKSSVAGALFLSLVPNATAVVAANDGTLTAGLIPLLLQGLAKQSDAFAQWLSGAVIPSQAVDFFKASKQYGGDFAVSYIFRRSDSYLTSAEVLQENIPRDTFLHLATMGQRQVPSPPMLYYQGVQDTLSPIANVDALIDKYCSHGADIIYKRATNGDHGSTGGYGLPDGFPWLIERLNNVPAPGGCSISNVTI